MEIKDLKPNTFYTRENNDELQVFKFEKCFKKSFIVTRTFYHENWEICVFSGIRNSTIEEQLWLEECIKQKKFISRFEISSFIKLSDVKANEYYYAEYDVSINGNAIVKAKENGSFDNSCGIRGDQNIYISSNSWFCNQNIRPATKEEIIHLNCCISHGTFMKKERALELSGLVTDSKPSMVSVLEDCVKKYPVGTTYICAGDGVSKFTVTAQNFIIYNNDTVYGETNKGCLYRYHKYAKIIEEPVKESIEESIPKYVECIEVWNGIGASIKGKIYNTSEKQNFSAFEWKRILEGLGKNFKPSTKEAFDAQNQPKAVKKLDTLEEWLSDTKKKNLYLKELESLIDKCDFDNIYSKLKGYNSNEKAKILFDEWNPKVQSIEKILEICKKKYPIGTVFKSMESDDSYTVNKELSVYYDYAISHIGIGYVYNNGKYAEIISLPEPIVSKVDRDYQVDDWIYVLQNKTIGCKLEAGKCYKITAISKTLVETELGHNGGQIYFTDIRRAYPHEIPVKVTSDDFKIGDIVVVTERYSNNIPVGYVSELIKLDMNSTVAKYQLKNLDSNITGWCRNIRKATMNEIFHKIFEYALSKPIPQGDGIMTQIERVHNSNTSIGYAALSNIQYGTPSVDFGTISTPKQTIISDIIEIKKIKTFTK